MRHWPYAAAALAAIAVACGGGSDAESDATSTAPAAATRACDPARPLATGEHDRTIASGGLQREYILHVPTGYDGTEALPVVLLFHGFALDGRIMLDYTELGDIADREGFLLVAPTGTGDPHAWNSSASPNGTDDVAFVDDLLAALDAELCTDPSRTFATGYSNGGGMSMRLVCDRPERFRATGLVASVYHGCTPRAPMIAFHGTDDPLVAFAGRGGLPPIEEAVASWAAALGCDPEPRVEQVSGAVEHTSYGGCPGGDPGAQIYVAEGAGHTWPGGSREHGDPDLTTYDINASELIWELFASRPVD